MSLLETDPVNGGKWIRIGDAYAVTRKPRGLDRSSVPMIPFAAMNAIPQGGAYMPEFTQRSPVQITSGTYFERGDVLVGKITPSFENGKQAFVNELAAPFGYATTEVIPLHPRSARHDPRFLFFYLLHPDVRHHVAERMEGSTGRKRVPEDVLLDLPIPNLDLRDQTAIADAFETIQQAALAEDECEQMVRNLKHSTMRVLFTRGLRGEAQKETEFGPIPESWELVSIADVFRIIQGISLKGNLSTDGHGTPFLRTSNVYWGQLKLKPVSRMHLRNTPSSEKNLLKGDLLVCEGGEIGRAAVWDGEIEGCLFQNHLHCLRPLDSARTEPRFVMAWLEEGFKHRNTYEGVGNRTTIPNISRNRLAELTIPHPRPDEQIEIVTILNAIDNKIDLHRRKRAVLKDLFKALLHKLMTGEIRVADLNLSALDTKSEVEVVA